MKGRLIVKSYIEVMEKIMYKSNQKARNICLKRGFPHFEDWAELFEVDEKNGTNYREIYLNLEIEERQKLLDEQTQDFHNIKLEVEKIDKDLKKDFEEYRSLFMEAHEKAQKIEDFEEREKCYELATKKHREVVSERDKRIREFEKEYYALKR